MKFIIWVGLGLILGPSVLNLEPPAWLTMLQSIAGGVFLFFAGWELRLLKTRVGAGFYGIIFAGTFLFPLIGGYFLLGQNLFLAVAMSLSALPVAIQILKEKNRYDTALARDVITIASLCDVVAWLILVFLFPAESASQWLLNHWSLFAFFAGLLVSRWKPWRPEFQTIQIWIAAPLFFSSLAWKTDLIRYFNLNVFAKIFFVAVTLKFVGTYVSARVAGEKSGVAFDLASLLNARGAIEILAAHFAFNAGIIDASLFAALVALGILTSLMAVLTIKSHTSVNGVPLG